MWSIILEDNRFKPYSTGFRKFFLLLYLLFLTIFCNYGVKATVEAFKSEVKEQLQI